MWIRLLNVWSSSAELLKKDKGDLWDSGKVESDQSIHVEYSGKPLESQMPCYWKVRVWDQAGADCGWSELASWTIGLLDAAEWDVVTAVEQERTVGDPDGDGRATTLRDVVVRATRQGGSSTGRPG